MSEVRRKARDLLWIHTHYNKGNVPKGQDTSLVVSKARAKKHAEVYTPREAELHKQREREARKAKREALKARELAEKGELPKSTQGEQLSLF